MGPAVWHGEKVAKTLSSAIECVRAIEVNHLNELSENVHEFWIEKSCKNSVCDRNTHNFFLLTANGVLLWRAECAKRKEVQAKNQWFRYSEWCNEKDLSHSFPLILHMNLKFSRLNCKFMPFLIQINNSLGPNYLSFNSWIYEYNYVFFIFNVYLSINYNEHECCLKIGYTSPGLSAIFSSSLANRP